jgi:hypothetical protein
VSDSELERLDARVMGEVLAVDAAVNLCTGLSAADKLLWQQKYANWQAEHALVQQALSSSILGLGDADMAATLTTIESDVLAMQNHVHGICPSVIAGTGGTSKDWGSIILTIALAAAVVSGLWALSPVLAAWVVSQRRAY